MSTGGEKQFIVVDATTGEKSPAFDQERVAAELSRRLGKNISGGALPFSVFRYTLGGRAIQFKVDDTYWICELGTGSCTSRVAPPGLSGFNVSPNGKLIIYRRGCNLWARDMNGTRDFPLTRDGSLYNDYGALPADYNRPLMHQRRARALPPEVLWSPDSQKIFTYRLDQREVRRIHLAQLVPDDVSFAPRLYSYRYPLPGDKAIALLRPVIIDIRTQSVLALATAALNGEPTSPIERRHVWWSTDGKRLYYIRRDRFSVSLMLEEVDIATGRVRKVVEETGTTALRVCDDQNSFADRPAIRVLSNGDVIWWSERDGWGHLYYIDGGSGAIRHRITEGEWVVRQVVSLDEQNGYIYFMAGGREQGRDPYQQYLYRVGFDGSGICLLTPEDADHRSPHSAASSSLDKEHCAEAEMARFSPSGRYLIDSHSRPDVPPVLVLRDSSGRLVKELERAEVINLGQGKHISVETFKVSAADGCTAIYGSLFRPSHFDPSLKYPIIDSIYPGPHSTRVSKSFADAVFDPLQSQSLAELGFIVITVDGRGTPHRSKAFLDYSYGQLEKASELEDHIAAIRQLSQRYSHMDADRVGIWGASAGGYAAARGILAYPDFFKVAVAASGYHDPRAYMAAWGETYLGRFCERAYERAANQRLAGDLRGKLLLIHGEMDNNVHPAHTLRLVDALVKAHKDFDLLIIPNADHSAFWSSPYLIRRMWDYFVRNLLGAEPPADYEIQQSTSATRMWASGQL